MLRKPMSAFEDVAPGVDPRQHHLSFATHNMFGRPRSGSITFRFACDKEDHHASDE